MSKKRLQMQKRTDNSESVDARIQAAYQLGMEEAERRYLTVTYPIYTEASYLHSALTGAIAQANFIAAHIAGMDQLIRPQLRESAQFIERHYYKLDELLAQTGGGLSDSLKNSVMEFHSAIMEYVTGRDSGERLMQCSMMQSTKSLEIRGLLDSIRIGGRAKDHVGYYLGEQLQKLMDSGMSQQAAAYELRNRLKDERQYIPDHRLEFPKAQALDILLEPYNSNIARFEKMRKRYREQL